MLCSIKYKLCGVHHLISASIPNWNGWLQYMYFTKHNQWLKFPKSKDQGKSLSVSWEVHCCSSTLEEYFLFNLWWSMYMKESNICHICCGCPWLLKCLRHMLTKCLTHIFTFHVAFRSIWNISATNTLIAEFRTAISVFHTFNIRRSPVWTIFWDFYQQLSKFSYDKNA